MAPVAIAPAVKRKKKRATKKLGLKRQLLRELDSAASWQPARPMADSGDPTSNNGCCCPTDQTITTCNTKTCPP